MKLSIVLSFLSLFDTHGVVVTSDSQYDIATFSPVTPHYGYLLEETPSDPLHSEHIYTIHDLDLSKPGETSKSCRYDEQDWSDCDPFELIRVRRYRLVSGGHQCEATKNETRKCIPMELPLGTQWLIDVHRKCLAELKRIKVMIADLPPYVQSLTDKGRTLLNNLLELKQQLERTENGIATLQVGVNEKQAKLRNLTDELEEWKAKTHSYSSVFENVKSDYHELEKQYKETMMKREQCLEETTRCSGDVDGLSRKKQLLVIANSELRRRLTDMDQYRHMLDEARDTLAKLEHRAERLTDKLDAVRDKVIMCRLKVQSFSQALEDGGSLGKDTRVKLSMDMWIVHNKSQESVVNPELQYLQPMTTPISLYPPELPIVTSLTKNTPKCLISYYGPTNVTCIYYDDVSSSSLPDVGGKQVVETHWKYFTVDVADQYECDEAAHRHYEYLLNRCKNQQHFLPILSIYRPNQDQEELGTHIYPMPIFPPPDERNKNICWITFLGPHGHCEKRESEHSYYNSDDTPEGYQAGSGTNKSKCLSRAQVWSSYCGSPVIATYLPEGISTSWRDVDIHEDSHGS